MVHDWLPVYGGAERVLEQMLQVVPSASLFSLIEFLEDEQRAFLNGRPVATSFMQRLPWARKAYRYYLPLAPLAIEQFDLRAYDVVVSSSYVVAKGVLTTAEQLHVSYVHSPVRYAWDLYFQYLKDGQAERGLKGLIARLVLHYLRLFDASSASRVDVFVANSKYVARRIWKTYRREAEVIYPPVDTDAFSLYEHKEDYYLTLSRLVPYKRIDLIVEAFSQMPDKTLVVIGDGPEAARLRDLAGPNIIFKGYQSQEVVHDHMQRARAFVFAAHEDFGIVPVEAQACGTPVIAYGRGGARETVLDGETGLFFHEQSADALQDAVQRFEAQRGAWEPGRIRDHALSFSVDRFRSAFAALLEREYASFLSTQHA
ncbi:MAG: glycosyltransferase family 4 protein [Bacteroidota bacterium]